MGLKSLIICCLLGQQGILDVEEYDDNYRIYAHIKDSKIDVHIYSIFFEDDPKYVWRSTDLIGRKAFVDIDKLKVIVKGISPRRYKELLKQEPRYSRLVEDMKSPKYIIRRTAFETLVKGGESSIPFLLYGLKSSDFEVRELCTDALEAIRLGQ